MIHKWTFEQVGDILLEIEKQTDPVLKGHCTAQVFKKSGWTRIEWTRAAHKRLKEKHDAPLQDSNN